MSADTVRDRLAEIERRCGNATDGPWAWASVGDKEYCFLVGADVFAEDDVDAITPLSGDLSHREDDYYVLEPVAELDHQHGGMDADFIAHARDDVPWLVAQLRAALTQLAAAERRLLASNDLLRSCFAIAGRGGAATNWDALCDRLGDELMEQHVMVNAIRGALLTAPASLSQERR